MRILLADDEPRVRSALRLLVEQELGLCVVGETAQAAGLEKLVQSTHPDLLLLDWELPCVGAAMLTLLHAIFPLLKIVALSGQPESGQTARQAGVDAFISKVDPPERLLNTLRAMHTKLE